MSRSIVKALPNCLSLWSDVPVRGSLLPYDFCQAVLEDDGDNVRLAYSSRSILMITSSYELPPSFSSLKLSAFIVSLIRSSVPGTLLAILSNGLLVSVGTQTQNPLSESVIGQILPAPSPPAKLTAVARRRPEAEGGGEGGRDGKELWIISAGRILIFDIHSLQHPLKPSSPSSPPPLIAPLRPLIVLNGSINAFEFNNDGCMLATAESNCLRVFRIAPPPSSAFSQVINFQSYYGGFLCCAFAPQGDIVAAGGEDDCVSLFSLTQRAIVARCVGHRAWVSSIHILSAPQVSSGQLSVDFFTAGHDGRIGFWRVQPQSLVIPRQRGRSKSISSPAPLHSVVHDNAPIPPSQRCTVPVVLPFSCSRVHSDAILHMLMTKSHASTVCVCGGVRIWEFLPPKMANMPETEEHNVDDASQVAVEMGGVAAAAGGEGGGGDVKSCAPDAAAEDASSCACEAGTCHGVTAAVASALSEVQGGDRMSTGERGGDLSCSVLPQQEDADGALGCDGGDGQLV